MFKNGVDKYATPERVYELCRIVANKDGISVNELREILEPSEFREGMPYFGYIKNAAIELGVIEEKEEISFVQDKKIIKTMSDFRMYCNSVLFNDPSWQLYKLCAGYLESDGTSLHTGSITSDENVRRIAETSTFPALTLQKDLIPATRFWIAFLGYGYIVKMTFIPNAYIAVKDFIKLANLEKGKEYSISEFIDALPNGISVLTSEAKKDKKLNLAMSNALRQLHDMKEIQLIRNLDSAERWTLYQNKSHGFSDNVTHLVYKGVK